MDIEVCAFDHAHPLGEPATRPIARLANRLAALLLLAESDHARRHALPDNSPDAHSGVFN